MNEEIVEIIYNYVSEIKKKIKDIDSSKLCEDLCYTPEELSDFDLAVLDPPRAGAKEQVLQLSESQVSRIIMVSCVPKTGARDIKILTDAGWHLTQITPVDQFTYSNHIEIVAILEK